MGNAEGWMDGWIRDCLVVGKERSCQCDRLRIAELVW